MRSASRLVAILLTSLATSCGKEACHVENLVFTQTVTGTGYGPTDGVPIARFDVTQNFLSHTPYAACTTGPLIDVGVVDVKITSLYSAPITLVYDLQGLSTVAVMVWSFRDSIPAIAPGQQVTRERIAVSSTKLEDGARVIITRVQPAP